MNSLRQKPTLDRGFETSPRGKRDKKTAFKLAKLIGGIERNTVQKNQRERERERERESMRSNFNPTSTPEILKAPQVLKVIFLAD